MLYPGDQPQEPRRVKLKVRFLGLRLARYLVWLRVIRSNVDRPTIQQWVEMARLAITSLLRGRSDGAKAMIRRNYAVCLRCPFHMLETHQCSGCGCQMTLKAAAGGTCWAREQDPDSTFGYPARTSAAHGKIPDPAGDRRQ